MTTPAQIQHLATRMGLPAVVDASGGYGVVRVVVNRDGRAEVFNPANDAEQSMAVLCWLMAQCVCHEVDRKHVRIHGTDHVAHDNTPPSLRAAILAAALRVAGET